MRKHAALVRIAGSAVSRTRCFTYSQRRSPSALAQQSGPMQMKRWRAALATPAFARPAAMSGSMLQLNVKADASHGHGATGAIEVIRAEGAVHTSLGRRPMKPH